MKKVIKKNMKKEKKYEKRKKNMKKEKKYEKRKKI